WRATPPECGARSAWSSKPKASTKPSRSKRICARRGICTGSAAPPCATACRTPWSVSACRIAAKTWWTRFPAARRELSKHIDDLRIHEGVTILLTTHILGEADRCDRLVLLHEGKIVAQGSPAELRSRIGGDEIGRAHV